MKKFFITITALMALFAITGCSTVEIIVPKATETLTTENPFTVKVHSDADVSTFWVKLDEEDITDLFGTITAGTTVTATPPPLKQLPVNGPFRHNIRAHARWVGSPRFFGTITVEHKFNALGLRLRPEDSSTIVCDPGTICIMELRMGETKEMRVELPETPYGELGLIVTPGQRILALEGQLPGNPARVVIPSHLRYVVFSIRGINTGETYVHAEASATESGSYKIRVIE
jgi:hypothetical protein